MPLDPKFPKAVAAKGQAVSAIGSGDKTQITVVACVSAAGYCVPPMLIWDSKILSPELTLGEVPGTVYGLSKNGWMDMELFDIWFCNHFLRYAPATRPLLLLLDGHSSHYCPDTGGKRTGNFIYSPPQHHSFVSATGQRMFWSPKSGLEGGLPSFCLHQPRESYHALSVFETFQSSVDAEHDNYKHLFRF